MSFDFRHAARVALERARAEMDSGNDARLAYAALELRMAMEALTYDRARTYQDELPESEYGTWQPKKLIERLLEVDPMANTGGTISVGLQERYGQPANEMKVLGTETVLKLETIKAHYDALGSYLHMPTLKQLQGGNPRDYVKLRKKCQEVAEAVGRALQSTVFNTKFGATSQFVCLRCGCTIRRRVPLGKCDVKTVCSECRAGYRLTGEDYEKTLWQPLHQYIPCPTENCAGTITVWADETKEGTLLKCSACQEGYVIGLGLMKSSPSK